MLFPEIDLIVPTAFELAADCGVAAEANVGSATSPAAKISDNAHTIGRHNEPVHLHLYRFISSTRTRGGRVRGIRLQLDVSQAAKCYTVKDYRKLNAAQAKNNYSFEMLVNGQKTA
jgi:hypothetical protein